MFHLNDFKNKKLVNAVIDSLNIGTFNYAICLNEHYEFVSKRVFVLPCVGAPPLFFLAIHRDYHNDPKKRSEYAKNFSVKDFCVALELYNLCCNEKLLYNELTHDIYISREDHLLNMASLHYNINFYRYLEDICYEFIFKSTERVALKDTLVNFLKECFFDRKYPSYNKFLQYGVDHPAHYDKNLSDIFIQQIKKEQAKKPQ